MKKHDGITRLIISVICSIIILMTAFINNLPQSQPNVFSEKETNQSELYFPTLSSLTEHKEQAEKEMKPAEKNENHVSEKASEPASTDTKVLGKVIEKFITPYTANTSYNNVYLKNSAGISIDLKELLNSSLSFKIEKSSKPQVLIMHTHTTESFLLEDRDYYTSADKSRTTDEKYNNVRLGEIVTEKLNSAGIVTIHDKTMHDYPEYNGSYTRSAATIKKYLKEHPSIKIVIDMHRDAVSSGESDKVKLVSEINGKKAAQIMLVMGSQSGTVTNHPNWKENLKLAVKLQQTLEVKYPTLARSILFCSRNYNQSLTKGSMLIEIGTDANTIEEVSYSAELLGTALTELLNRLE